MDSSTKPSFLLSITLIFFFFAFLCFKPTLAVATLNYTNLIYNHCPNQTPTIPSSTLSSLFQQLIAQSSQFKFFETIVPHENTVISGLFQCRGDLNFQDCNNCVNRVGKLSNSLCANTVPVRIQLSGCYVRYEADSGAVNSRYELLHKDCGESKEYGGFTEKRDVGFEEVIGCVGSNSDGFCEKKVEGMKVMAQCEGKIRGCECGECVSNAVEVAKEDCRDSVSAQIYVEGCFLSYSYDYYSHGEHQKEHPGGKLTKLKSVLKRWQSLGKLSRSGSSIAATNHSSDNDDDDCQTTQDHLYPFYVGKSCRRYLISSEVADHPLFCELIDLSNNSETVTIGCEVVLFEHLLWMLKNGDPQPEPLDKLVDFYAC